MEVIYRSSSENMQDDDEALIIKHSSISSLLNAVTKTNYRWFILAIYSLTGFSNTLVWLSLFTVTETTCIFYTIDEEVFLWSSNAFTLIQVLIAIPASFLPSKLGLRPAMVIAAAINAIGASVMIAATNRNGFPYFVIGQTIIAISASILPQLAPEVSAVWFGEKEQAISTSIGVILGNAGAAVGFLQPALLLKDIDPKTQTDFIQERFKALIFSQTALCVTLFIFVIIFFKNKPNCPPSNSEAVRMSNNGTTLNDFRDQYKVLLKDFNYHLCGNSYALNSVLIIVIPVFLSEIIGWRFTNKDATIGWMGFAGILVGILGSVVFGLLLDKTQRYKCLSLSLSFASIIFWLAFTESIAQWNNMAFTFSMFVVCTFVFIPCGPILVAMIAEMTYPISESSSYVLPITLGRLYSIPFVFVLGWLVGKRRIHLVCLIVTGVLAICFVLVMFAKVNLKRKAADHRLVNHVPEGS